MGGHADAHLATAGIQRLRLPPAAEPPVNDAERAPSAFILAAALPALRGAGTVVTPSAAVAQALAPVTRAVVARVEEQPTGSADAVALLADEISVAGDHAEGLLAAAVASVRPGGLVAVSARGAVASAPGALRTFRSDELRRALGHCGVDVDLLCAPGAAAAIRGAALAYDPDLDVVPGVLDAAPNILAVGRAPRSGAERSAIFFSTLPRKVVASGVLCRDAQGRVLVVHDTFKQYWTIPGGVVDADEDPRTGAVREAWEEAGVRVEGGALLGVFTASWPDRMVLVYDAAPVAGAEDRGGPLHTHEIDAVAWLPLDEALQRLTPHVAEQVRHCLDNPGGTLRQRMA